MKALTVRQPWAWAIIHAEKLVENRRQYWGYRGPLLIHAGAQLDERGCNEMPDLLDENQPALLGTYADASLTMGAVVGVVDVLDAHFCHTVTDYTDERVACCEPWGEHEYDYSEGHARSLIVHYVLGNVRALPDPIPAKGRLGLWTPSADLVARVADQVAV